MRDGQIEVGFVHKGLDEFMHKLDAVMNRLVVALVVTGGLIGSSLIGIFARAARTSSACTCSRWSASSLSGVLGVWLLWGVVRSGRLYAPTRSNGRGRPEAAAITSR